MKWSYLLGIAVALAIAGCGGVNDPQKTRVTEDSLMSVAAEFEEGGGGEEEPGPVEGEFEEGEDSLSNGDCYTDSSSCSALGTTKRDSCRSCLNGYSSVRSWRANIGSSCINQQSRCP
jgi:hypothetical protein